MNKTYDIRYQFKTPEKVFQGFKGKPKQILSKKSWALTSLVNFEML